MTGSATPQPKDRIRELDGLRGIACALVLLWHLVNRQIGPAEGGAWGWIRTGLSQSWSGVDLFFVLSGYLIIRNLSRDSARDGWVGRFIAARAFRLIPAYALLLAGAALLAAWVERAPGASGSERYLVQGAHPMWVYLCFGQNWYPILRHVGRPLGSEFLSVTWSLGAEIEFYAGSLLLFMYCPDRFRLRALMCAAVAAVLFRCYILAEYPFPGISAWILPPARMDGFALGGCAALWLEQASSREAAMRMLPAIKACWAVLLALVLVLVVREAPFVGRLAALCSYACFALFYAHTLVIILLGAGSRALAWIRRGPLAGLGIISYGVYLFHKPFHTLFANALNISDTYLTFGNGALYLLLELGLLLLFSASVWFCIEKPIIRLGRRLSRGPRTAPAPQPSPPV
jgi:peptidoglycan/LPS O-acetylase OafA/YrhL